MGRHEDVEAPQGRSRVLHGPGRRPFLARVRRDRQGPAARRLDLGRDRLEAGAAPREEGDGSPFAGKRPGDRTPDPPAPPRDERGLTREPHRRHPTAGLARVARLTGPDPGS